MNGRSVSWIIKTDNGRQLQVAGLKPLENNLDWLRKKTAGREIRCLEYAEQDRQCMYIATLRGARETTVAVGKQ
jgi:hypothetical protein